MLRTYIGVVSTTVAWFVIVGVTRILVADPPAPRHSEQVGHPASVVRSSPLMISCMSMAALISAAGESGTGLALSKSRSIEVLVPGTCRRQAAEAGRARHPGTGLPVVHRWLFRQEGWQRKLKEHRQGVDKRLVQIA